MLHVFLGDQIEVSHRSIIREKRQDDIEKHGRYANAGLKFLSPVGEREVKLDLNKCAQGNDYE